MHLTEITRPYYLLLNYLPKVAALRRPKSQSMQTHSLSQEYYTSYEGINPKPIREILGMRQIQYIYSQAIDFE